jgi:superfamily II DNA or RNA helicase
MIELRDYQLQMIEEARAEMRRHKCVLMQAATGAGKTVLGSYMLHQTIKKAFDAFFIVHRRDLITQTALTFDQFGIRHSYVTADHGYNPYAKAHICSIDTLKNRLKHVKIPKLVMVDECHMANSAGWSKVLDFYRDNGSWIIGLSATPWRLSGDGLNRHFSAMITGPSMRRLIDNGNLSDYRYFAPSTPDMTGVKTVAGDYAKGAMAETIQKQKNLVGDAIKHYRKHAEGMRAIAYCVSRKHSEQVAMDFNAAGIPAQHIDGETPMNERKRIISAFANGTIKVLTNVELITTGFDLAAQVGRDVQVECIIQLRPTQSLSLYLQMVGRGLRADDKPHIILDHAGNAAKHGLPCEDREWTLEGREKKKGASSRESDIKTRDCPNCFYVHTPALSCPNCGHVYEIKGREIGFEEGDLQEIKSASAEKEKQKQAERSEFFMLVNVAKKNGIPNPRVWAKNKMIAKKKGLA